jgi:hypothetical protein
MFSVKNTLSTIVVLLALSLSVWASSPVPVPTKKPTTAVPEGGNWPTYTIVSGVALLAGLMLARKQRANATIANVS